MQTVLPTLDKDFDKKLGLGTDLFFLSIEIPTSRKRIFGGKVVFLMSFFLIFAKFRYDFVIVDLL